MKKLLVLIFLVVSPIEAWSAISADAVASQGGNDIIVWLSLIIAILAVVVGPIVTLKISKRQVVAPMRQAWINSLRELIAEITSTALHHHVAGHDEREDEEYKRLTELESKISLMLNLNEEDHKRLHDLIRIMLESIGAHMDRDQTFQKAHTEIMSLSRSILKREWDRVKK